MPFRLRTCRLWKFTNIFGLCVVALIFITALQFHETGNLKPVWLFRPALQWNVDRSAGCPASAATPTAPLLDNKLASPLSPADLMCRPAPSDLLAVPKLLHQTWKSTELPAKFEGWSKTCREKHPDWEWVLWTDEDNLELVRKYFPWLEDTYTSLPGDIYRVDLVRNMYMYMFGGVYADLDTECLRPTSAALDAFDIRLSDGTGTPYAAAENASRAAVFGRMGTDPAFKHSIPNAWMAGSPGHPFFLMPLTAARGEIAKSRRFLHQFWYDFPSAEQMTGPIALRKSVLRYNNSGLGLGAADLEVIGPFAEHVGEARTEVTLLPEHWVYPFNWHNGPDLRAICSAEQDTFDAVRCRQILRVEEKGSMSITYWSHTHRGKGADAKNIEMVSHEK